MRSPSGGLENAIASSSRLVKMADIFLSAITFHGHLWLLNELLVEALSALGPCETTRPLDWWIGQCSASSWGL